MGILGECPMCHRRQSIKRKVCACGEDLEKAKRSNRIKYSLVVRIEGKQTWKSLTGIKDVNPYSLKDARDTLGKYRSAKREGRLEIFDLKPEAVMTLNDLCKWYLELDRTKGLSSYKTIQSYLDKACGQIGKKVVGQIKPADLQNLQAKRTREGFKPKTVDDEILYLKMVVNRAFENQMVGGDVLRTFRAIKKTLKPGANTRTRTLTVEDFDNLIEQAPRHLRELLIIAYWTGMRKGEVLSLTWNKVALKDRMIRLIGSDTKEGKPKSIPMAAAVHDLISSIPRALHDAHVFLLNGNPIRWNFANSIRKACEKAGIKYGRRVEGGFTYHDLRHTFTTDMRRAGVPWTVTASICGHSSGSNMNMRYDAVEDSDKLDGINRLSVYREGLRKDSGNSNVSKSVSNATLSPDQIA